MPKAAKLNKTPEMRAVEKEKLHGKCLAAWLRNAMNDGNSHEQIAGLLNMKRGTLAKWIERLLDRRYVIRGQA